MSEYPYSYDVSIFQNGYEPVQLCKEIDESPDIAPSITRINSDTNQGVLIIYFDAELTADEKNFLDLIVQNHTPIGISDYEFDQNIDLLGNRILNIALPQSPTDGVNKEYVDYTANQTANQAANQAAQSANAHTDQTALDILEGRRDFNEAQLDINRLSGIPSGGLVGKDALQTITNKTIDVTNGNNTILNIGNTNIKSGARIDVRKIGDGLVNNNELKHLANIKSNVQDQIDSVGIRVNDHANQKNNPHQVSKSQVGLGSLENIKSNYTAIRKPTNLDDILSGYSVGSIWINRTTNVGYVCSDNTEMNAKWLEITSLGEITHGLNVGNGIGLYLDKIGSTHRFRTIVPGSNVFFSETSNDITIRSRDSHSFLLSPIEIEVISNTYRGILTFPWLRSEFGSYSSGKIIFEAVVPVGMMNIRLRNITDKSTLGEMANISESGFYELDVASPSNNARIRIEVMRNGAVEERDNPRIFGIVLKYET